MSQAKNYILVINSGSATLKFKVFNQSDFKVALSGMVERIGLPNSFFKLENRQSQKISEKKYPAGLASHQMALAEVLIALKPWQDKIKAIGHRVVHGGQEFTAPTLVKASVLTKLKKYNELAPLHNPINLACLSGCLKAWPNLPNIAVFDTAFYKTLPAFAYLYSLPYEYYVKYGIRRYGFHGISHQYASQEAAKKLGQPLKKLKLITCHLGSGCSMTAIKNGVAVETSMGFTPLEGLTMGTRSGDLDPAVPLYLMEKLNLTPKAMAEILNKKSGLLGIFGATGDLRDIMTAAGYKIPGFDPGHKFTARQKTLGKLALDIFIYDIIRYIGSYAMILGGLDAVVFTAGIGERNADVRKLVMAGVNKFLKKVKAVVIPANEELMIAQEVKRLANK